MKSKVYEFRIIYNWYWFENLDDNALNSPVSTIWIGFGKRGNGRGKGYKISKNQEKAMSDAKKVKIDGEVLRLLKVERDVYREEAS